MSKETQQKKAQKFLELHSNSELLILPNIWNPIGARILEAKGYPAAATASAAISASLGYEDGEKIKLSTLIDIITRIANSVDIPISADIESGYADSVFELKENIKKVIESGVVGINIEDSANNDHSLRTIDEQCERIQAVRAAADNQNIHLVINARIDCFLTNDFHSNEERIDESVKRAEAYIKAGADCIYPIGPGDEETVKKLRSRISAPLNIFASSGALSLRKMKALGINRVSFGPNLFRSCLSKFSNIAEELINFGSYDCFSKEMMSKKEVNPYLKSEFE